MIVIQLDVLVTNMQSAGNAVLITETATVFAGADLCMNLSMLTAMIHSNDVPHVHPTSVHGTKM